MNDQVDFCVYILHALSKKWGRLPAEVYKTLKTHGIIDDYILKCFDTLHTQGVDYLVEDLSEMVAERSTAA